MNTTTRNLGKEDAFLDRLQDILKKHGQPFGMLYLQENTTGRLPTANQMHVSVVRGVLPDGRLHISLRIEASTLLGMGSSGYPHRYAIHFVRQSAGNWHIEGESFLGLPFVYQAPEGTKLRVERAEGGAIFSNPEDYNFGLLDELLRKFQVESGSVVMSHVGGTTFLTNICL